MSVYISAAVWKNPSIRGSQKLVLLKLADSADDQGMNAWPSAETIARECGLGVRTVYRILDGLEKAGHLVLQHPANTVHPSATYQVIPDPCQTGNGEKLAPLPSETPTPATVATDPSVIRPSVDVEEDLDQNLPLPLRGIRSGSGAKRAQRWQAPVRSDTWTALQAAYRSLTAKLDAPPFEEDQFTHWESLGCTATDVDAALAIVAERAPDKPWPFFKTRLGERLARVPEVNPWAKVTNTVIVRDE